MKKIKKSKGEVKAGALYAVTAIGIIGLFGTLLSGGITPTLRHLTAPPPQGPLYTCCDSGEGAACHPLTENQITFNGDAYGLLKSNIVQSESYHIVPTNQFTPDGHRIFTNESGATDDYGGKYPGCEHGKDLVGLQDPSKPKIPCFGVPNDELVYVCTDTVAACNHLINNGTTPFNVYYRLKDGAVPPEIASYCPKPKNIAPSGGASSAQEVIGIPTPGGRKNLQLEWFQVQQHKQLYRWLGAWCKPAINLYPTEKTQVQVAVAPKGDFTLTIPSYPKEGWIVTAYPDGTIKYGTESYPYLFWEAAIPDSLIKEPQTGYVVEYKELSDLFNTVLPQLGLNEREQKQFTEYWLKALPKSPYYFVGVVPQKEIDTLAPLTISPAPDSLLRVTLLFKALDKSMTVTAPELSGFTRKGFTVTEWGGFFKADKNHKGFTCLM